MSLTVMIVDNSPVMRKILERSLRQAWQDRIDKVIEAQNGEEAFEKLDNTPVNVIFSDIEMPGAGGLDLLRRLKDGPHKDVPVILVSTEGTEKRVLQAISLGAKGFIRKPFTPEQLQATLARVQKLDPSPPETQNG